MEKPSEALKPDRVEADLCRSLQYVFTPTFCCSNHLSIANLMLFLSLNIYSTPISSLSLQSTAPFQAGFIFCMHGLGYQRY